MHIIILGLRRSGTTAFRKMWRQDERFVCYNEPFGHIMARINDDRWSDFSETGIEMHTLWERDPISFWDHFVAIPQRDEFRRGMSDQQREYMAWLLESAEHLCVDLTRCHLKIVALKQVVPDAVLVHLRRPPQNWVTSIAVPNSTKLNQLKNRRFSAWRKFTRRSRDVLAKRRFWNAQRGFGHMGYEGIMGSGADSLIGYRLREAGLAPEAVVVAMPLVGRLLALWKLYNEETEMEGANHFGDRFLSINFNKFCRSLDAIIGRVYERLGAEAPSFDFSSIHPPSAAFAPSTPEWNTFFDTLQIDRLWLAAGQET